MKGSVIAIGQVARGFIAIGQVSSGIAAGLSPSGPSFPRTSTLPPDKVGINLDAFDSAAELMHASN